METNENKNENQKPTSPSKIFQVTKMSSSGVSTTNTITTASSSSNNNNNNNAQQANVNNNNNQTTNSSVSKSSGISKFNNFIRQLFETNEHNETSAKNNCNNNKNDTKLKPKNILHLSAKNDTKKESSKLIQNDDEKSSDNKNKNETQLNDTSNVTPSTPKIKSKKELNLILNRTLSDSVLERKSAVYSINHHNNHNPNYTPTSKKDYYLSRKNSSNRRSIYAGAALNNSFSPVHNSKKNSLFLSTSPSPLSFTTPTSSTKQSSLLRANLNHHKSTCSIYHNNHNNNNSPNFYDSPRRICDNLLDLNHQKNKLNIERDQMNIKRISSLLSVSSASAESPTIVKKKLINAISIGPQQQQQQQQQQQPYCGSPQTKTVLNNINNEKSSSPVVFQSNDARRWSFASSSGYGTNTPVNTMEENNNSNQKNNNNSNSSQHSSNDLLSISYKQQNNVRLPSNLSLDRSLSNNQQQQHQPIEIHLTPQSARMIDYEAFQFNSSKRSRINSSNEDSSQLDDSSEAGFSPSISFHRQRARSLSCSPAKEYNDSDIIIIQNETFKEKFPKACSQMEEKLDMFVESNKDLIDVGQCQLDPAARFVHNQVIELAKLCLEKSRANQLNSDYFDEITATLERLIQEAKEKFIHVDTSLEHLRKLIRSFLLIISRVARLLECIEFDPLKFCSILDAAEEQVKHELTKADIPKYVISKLGLNRDPFEDIHKLGLNDEESDSSLTNINNKSDINIVKSSSLKNSICTPSQADFEEIKLISNGAYGAGKILIFSVCCFYNFIITLFKIEFCLNSFLFYKLKLFFLKINKKLKS